MTALLTTPEVCARLGVGRNALARCRAASLGKPGRKVK